MNGDQGTIDSHAQNRIDRLEQRISDLEAKLDVKVSKIDSLEQMRIYLNKVIYDESKK